MKFKVDLCVKPPGFGTVVSTPIHHFADASEDGYGTASHLCPKNKAERRHCEFIVGKFLVAPLKQTTIPRLELTAATAAVPTDKMLKGELDMQIDCTVYC